MYARSWTVLGLLISAAAVLSGCDAELAPSADAAATLATAGNDGGKSVSAKDFAGKSPDELRQVVDESQAAADQLADMLKSRTNYRLRMKEFRRHVNTAAAAADALAAHPDIPATEQDRVRQRKLRLIYTAAQTDRSAFEQRLADEVQKLTEQEPHSQSAVVGDALLLELTTLSGEDPHEEKMAALNEFVDRHAGSDIGLALFMQYGEQLERKKQQDAALECYAAAVASFPNSPQLAPARAKLESHRAARRERLARERAHQEKIADIRRQLVNQDGYFLIYTFETDKTLYRFEYDVIQGADAAVAHILGVPDKWDWKITARFPETADGLARANALKKQREKKETYMRVPTFGP